MSRVRDLVGWGLLPFVLGAAVSLLRTPSTLTAPDVAGWSAPPPPPRQLESRAAAPEARRPSPELRTSTGREPEPLRCDELERQLATLDGLVQEWWGEAPRWPDDSVNPQLGEPGFATWMEQVAMDVPGTSVVEIDCSQYPCVGVWRVEELDARALGERGENLSELRVLMRMLPIHDGEGGTTHWMVATSAFAPGSADPALVSLRMNTALSASGWHGYETVHPDDPEAAVPFLEEL